MSFRISIQTHKYSNQSSFELKASSNLFLMCEIFQVYNSEVCLAESRTILAQEMDYVVGLLRIARRFQM